MSKDNYDFSDLDAILAEFRGGDEAVGTPAPKPGKIQERRPAPEEARRRSRSPARNRNPQSLRASITSAAFPVFSARF